MSQPNPPGTTILTKVFTGVTDANGNGSAIGSPAVNEYWLPLTIRVASKSKVTPVPACTVYIGSTSAVNQGDFTTYVDDTALGSSDTTSMCSGVVVQFGESVGAKWTGGNPNDNLVLIVTGIVSNVPPSIGWLPQVPGTHFVGHLVTQTTTLLDSGSMNLSSGQSVNLANTTGLNLDLRQYASYLLEITAIATTPPATAFNPISVALQFVDKPVLLGGSKLLYTEGVTFWADAATPGAFALSYGQVFIQDVVHGPYIQGQIINNTTGTDFVTVTWALYGSTEAVGQPYIRQGNSNTPPQLRTIEGILFDVDLQALVAGVADIPLPLTYGPVELILANHSGANIQQFHIVFGKTAVVIGGNGFIAQVAAGMTTGNNPRLVLQFPKASGLIHVTGTTTDQFGIRAITSFNKV